MNKIWLQILYNLKVCENWNPNAFDYTGDEQQVKYPCFLVIVYYAIWYDRNSSLLHREHILKLVWLLFLKWKNERIHFMTFYSWHKNAIVQFTITPGGRLSTVWAVSFLPSKLEIPSCCTAGGLEIILSDNLSGCDE